MKTIFELIERIYNSIRYNGLFILLSVLFPLVFFSFDAGKDIIDGLLGQSKEINFTVLFSAFSFLVLSFSSWCIPVLGIKFFSFVTNSHCNEYDIFQKIENYYNGETTSSTAQNNCTEVTENTVINESQQIDVKYIALLPWIIFNISLIFSAWRALSPIYIIIYLTVLSLSIYFINKLFTTHQLKIYEKIDTQPEKWRFLALAAVVFLVYLLASLPLFYFSVSKVTLCLYFFVGSLILYLFFQIFNFIKSMDHDIAKEDIHSFNYRSSLYIHTFCVAISCVAYLYFFIANRNAVLSQINPVIVSILLSSAIILFIEMFITSQLLIVKLFGEDYLKIKVYKFYVIAFTVVFFSMYFFYSTNDSLIRTEKASQIRSENYSRETLEDYFDQWYAKRMDTAKVDTLNVFLVSGQGGGSRAGVWFLGNMMKLDEKSPRFYNHIFSISTVSGSSSGANMYLAKHFVDQDINYNRLHPSKEALQKTKGTDRISQFITDIYDKNYISSGIFGFLINDFTLQSITNLIFKEERDRNYALQKEEMKNFENAYLNFHKIAASSRQQIESRIRSFFERDYLDLYLNPHDRLKHPLFMINTTLVSSGSKGVFSPVLLFPTANSEDVYGNFRKCIHNDGKALPMVTCVNQSQAFPFLNSYNFTHGSGRLADGGMWENTGTETTLVLYQRLNQHILKQGYKAKVYVITLNNGKINEKNDPSYVKASFLNTITALTKSPFYGREYLAFQNLKEKVPAKYHFQSAPKNNYTLTRFLNKKDVASILKEITNESPINSAAAITNAVNGLVTNTAENSERIRIYIQYNEGRERGAAAKTLKANLQKLGTYDVKALEKVTASITSSSIRFFNSADARSAAEINRLLGRIYKISDFSGIYSNIPEGQIEIWMSKNGN